MWLRLAALAAFAAVPCALAQDRPPAPLSLDEALRRVSDTHPQLRLIDGERPVLEARRDAAALAPATSLGVELENALGSGQTRAFDSAELTVSLSGVLERGGKLDARRALAQANLDALAPRREAARLDVLAQVAQRYQAIALAQRALAIARLDIDQRRRAVQAAQARLQAGASPESVLLTAQAQLAQAELDRDRALAAGQAARRQLATLWGQREADFDAVSGDLEALPRLESFDALSRLLERTPELAIVAGQARVSEAQLRLATSARSADVQWQLGVRRLQDAGDTALVAGFSLPLGGARRAEPEIRAAQAELAVSTLQRDAVLLQLHATLAEAHGRYLTAQLETQRLARDVLPRLQQAERAAERAWRAGAISYLEWAQLQAQRVEALRRQLDAAAQAQTALIELQRLTGQPVVAPHAAQEISP
ncbi:TolC family protein [Pseudoxanthomonas winnipegensis]|uniref:TolC family protein n=1 Tax=Pseudoxanthomonas winnipegensis TaxID=2480810 RepID=UPI002576EFC7|nr:TolC family protein [Pseudoxanthomonas winnipegensis]WJI15184.1 TolC family protein [Pseudoxanthomonas winnipegensis]